MKLPGPDFSMAYRLPKPLARSFFCVRVGGSECQIGPSMENDYSNQG